MFANLKNLHSSLHFHVFFRLLRLFSSKMHFPVYSSLCYPFLFSLRTDVLTYSCYLNLCIRFMSETLCLWYQNTHLMNLLKTYHP